MENEKYLTGAEVCVLIGCSIYTLNNWYTFKRQNPGHELAQLLPEFYQTGDRQKRVWKSSDIGKLIEFRDSIPIGRNGVMGNVTQKYYKKERANGRRKKENKKTNKGRKQRAARNRKSVVEG